VGRRGGAATEAALREARAHIRDAQMALQAEGATVVAPEPVDDNGFAWYTLQRIQAAFWSVVGAGEALDAALASAPPPERAEPQ